MIKLKDLDVDTAESMFVIGLFLKGEEVRVKIPDKLIVSVSIYKGCLQVLHAQKENPKKFDMDYYPMENVIWFSYDDVKVEETKNGLKTVYKKDEDKKV